MLYDSKTILACNKEFVRIIRLIRPTGNTSMKLNWIDILFTVYMKDNQSFDNYIRVFQSFYWIYT